jgi:hypothetical protein
VDEESSVMEVSETFSFSPFLFSQNLFFELRM